VPWANTTLLYFVIDPTNPNYGSYVTPNGNDRNTFWGGIFESANYGIIVDNPANFTDEQNWRNVLNNIEFDVTMVININSSPYQANIGILEFMAGYFGWGSNGGHSSPFCAGTGGYLKFSEECVFIGGDALDNRGISSIDNNYYSLYYIDTDHCLDQVHDIYGALGELFLMIHPLDRLQLLGDLAFNHQPSEEIIPLPIQ
jgi:hypothetical protein